MRRLSKKNFKADILYTDWLHKEKKFKIEKITVEISKQIEKLTNLKNEIVEDKVFNEYDELWKKLAKK